MQEERLTLEVSTQSIAACSICRANNFDNNKYAMGRRVDRLYELQIGGMAMTLCDKCLDRLRERLAQRFDAEEKPEPATGRIVLFTGTEFTATDKLSKTYRYRMVGAEVTRNGLTRLLNLDTNRLTFVEPEWFRQRKIKVIQKTGDWVHPTENLRVTVQDAPNPGFYDEVGGYHEGGCGTAPNGHFCGECSKPSCAKCEAWLREQEGGLPSE